MTPAPTGIEGSPQVLLVRLLVAKHGPKAREFLTRGRQVTA
jgi:hypothetical protein